MIEPSTEARARINSTTTKALIETANARVGGPVYDDWERGSMRRRVAVGDVVLQPGDVVLWIEGKGSAIKVWSPFVTRLHTLVLPFNHVEPSGSESAEEF